jgi:hypothetical protein
MQKPGKVWREDMIQDFISVLFPHEDITVEILCLLKRELSI